MLLVFASAFDNFATNYITMKKIISLFLLLLITQGVFAQKLSSQRSAVFEKALNEYIGFMQEKDYDKMMDYVNPKLFDHAPRAQMIQVLESPEKMGMNMSFEDMEILELIPLDESGDYILAKYRLNLDVTLMSEQLQNEQAVNMMRDAFVKQSSEENVSYNEETHTFSINDSKKYMIGTYENNKPSFLELDLNNPPMVSILKSIVPAEIIEKAKTKMDN